jgi:hypothetical protein
MNLYSHFSLERILTKGHFSHGLFVVVVSRRRFTPATAAAVAAAVPVVFVLCVYRPGLAFLQAPDTRVAAGEQRIQL